MQPKRSPRFTRTRRAGRIGPWVAALCALLASGILALGPQQAMAMPAMAASTVHTGMAASTVHTGMAASTVHTGHVASTTPTSRALAGTTLEADSRNDGTRVAPWFIWSGIAAAASVLIGGLLLKRRMT